MARVSRKRRCKYGVVKSGPRRGLCKKPPKGKEKKKNTKKGSFYPMSASIRRRNEAIRKAKKRKAQCKYGVVKSGSREGLCKKAPQGKKKGRSYPLEPRVRRRNEAIKLAKIRRKLR